MQNSDSVQREDLDSSEDDLPVNGKEDSSEEKDIPTSLAPSIQQQFDSIDSSSSWTQLYYQLRLQSCYRDLSTEEAKHPRNRELNRYRDVNPYDHTRIVLDNVESNKTGYINASLVSVPQANRKYILAQGPLPNTVGHFWLMIWQQNSQAVVMLNRVIEKNQVKCSLYWPDGEMNSHVNELHCEDVHLIVRLQEQKNLDYYVTRTFLLENTQTHETKKVFHFHYTTWPDFGVPESPGAFLHFLSAVRDSGSLSSEVGPCVIHCSAGIGRSGTFCLVDSALVLFLEKKQSVDVKELLLQMRRHRMGLIQTPDQLRFSYLAILEGINNGIGSREESKEEVPVCEEEAPPPLPPRSDSLSASRRTSSEEVTSSVLDEASDKEPDAKGELEAEEKKKSEEREERRKRTREMVDEMRVKQRRSEDWRHVSSDEESPDEDT